MDGSQIFLDSGFMIKSQNSMFLSVVGSKYNKYPKILKISCQKKYTTVLMCS